MLVTAIGKIQLFPAQLTSVHADLCQVKCQKVKIVDKNFFNREIFFRMFVFEPVFDFNTMSDHCYKLSISLAVDHVLLPVLLIKCRICFPFEMFGKLLDQMF